MKLPVRLFTGVASAMFAGAAATAAPHVLHATVQGSAHAKVCASTNPSIAASESFDSVHTLTAAATTHVRNSANTTFATLSTLPSGAAVATSGKAIGRASASGPDLSAGGAGAAASTVLIGGQASPTPTATPTQPSVAPTRPVPAPAPNDSRTPGSNAVISGARTDLGGSTQITASSVNTPTADASATAGASTSGHATAATPGTAASGAAQTTGAVRVALGDL